MNIEKQKVNNDIQNTESDLKVGDKVRKHVKGLVDKMTQRWSDNVCTVKSIQGQTITLNNESRHKRSDLLHVPGVAQDFKDNPLISATCEIISNKRNLKPNTLKQIRSQMRKGINTRNKKQTATNERSC